MIRKIEINVRVSDEEHANIIGKEIKDIVKLRTVEYSIEHKGVGKLAKPKNA